jgi:hypothetical protein
MSNSYFSSQFQVYNNGVLVKSQSSSYQGQKGITTSTISVPNESFDALNSTVVTTFDLANKDNYPCIKESILSILSEAISLTDQENKIFIESIQKGIKESSDLFEDIKKLFEAINNETFTIEAANGDSKYEFSLDKEQLVVRQTLQEEIDNVSIEFQDMGQLLQEAFGIYALPSIENVFSKALPWSQPLALTEQPLPLRPSESSDLPLPFAGEN